MRLLVYIFHVDGDECHDHMLVSFFRVLCTMDSVALEDQ